MNWFPLYLTTPECEMKVLYFCYTAEGAIQPIEKNKIEKQLRFCCIKFILNAKPFRVSLNNCAIQPSKKHWHQSVTVLHCNYEGRVSLLTCGNNWIS